MNQGEEERELFTERRLFYHEHCLELPAHSSNKEQIAFSWFLLLFLNSL